MKYDVTYSCGHTGTVNLIGKESERARKLEWYATSGLCPECYKAACEAAEAEQPITIHVSATTQINRNGQPLFCVWLSGNTRPSKDDIKACGFYWRERSTGSDMFSAKATFCWCRNATAEELESVVESLKPLGAVIDKSWNAMDIISAQIASDAAAEYAKKQSAIATIEKPTMPAFISGRWNGKLYGKKGNYSVYLDGEKKVLTDSEADEVKAYQNAKAEYDKKVAEIR